MGPRFAFGPFLFDTERGTLSRDGETVAIGQRCHSVLRALLEARGAILSKEALMKSAWPALVVEESNLSVQIAALRKALGRTPMGEEWIVTVPRSGYRFVGSYELDEGAAGADTDRAGHHGRPSIAVMPFASLSDGPAQEYLADGITEDVIAALTRFRWFSVTGRNASFVYKRRVVEPRTVARELGVDYLLEGVLRRQGGAVRISVELIDAHRGTCLWADHFALRSSGVFAAQDAIALQVAGAIEPELLRSEGGIASTRRRSGTLTGWDLVAQGSWFFHQLTKPTHLEARKLFRQACQVDAGLMEARLWLGRVSAGLVAYGWTENAQADLQEGLGAALQAVRMDPQSPYAHYALAIVSVYSDSFALAKRAAEKAIELNPSFALGHLVLGMARLFSGEVDSAAEALERGLHLNRHDPQNYVWFNVLALAYLFGGRPADALARAIEALKVRPAGRSPMETAAASCAALGQLDAARRWRSEFVTLPKLRDDALQPLWRCNPEWSHEMQRLLACIGP